MRLKDRKHSADRGKTKSTKARENKFRKTWSGFTQLTCPLSSMNWWHAVDEKKTLSDDFMRKVLQQLNCLLLHAFHYTSCYCVAHKFSQFMHSSTWKSFSRHSTSPLALFMFKKKASLFIHQKLLSTQYEWFTLLMFKFRMIHSLDIDMKKIISFSLSASKYEKKIEPFRSIFPSNHAT